jgi:hypothetical protein
MDTVVSVGVYPNSIDSIGSEHEIVEESWPTEAASLSSDHTGTPGTNRRAQQSGIPTRLLRRALSPLAAVPAL